MTKDAAFRLGFAALMLGAALVPAWAATETGFAAMHNQARVGGKLCMTDHYHYGSGTGRTKDLAQRAAIGSWQSFTDFEYGSVWARFSNAVAKRVSCSQSGSGYSCQVEARPCRK